MKNVVIIIVMFLSMLLMLSSSMAGEGLGYEPEKCEIPSSSVRITVKQEGDVFPVYAFAITNLYNSPINLFSIGRSPHGTLEAGVSDEYIPIKVMSPEEWDGPPNYRTDSGSIYFNYSWAVKPEKDNYQDYFIKPGETLTGFKLVMLEPLEYFKTAPFQVYFGRWYELCAYGMLVWVK
jgi:hypothetical protein